MNHEKVTLASHITDSSGIGVGNCFESTNGLAQEIRNNLSFINDRHGVRIKFRRPNQLDFRSDLTFRKLKIHEALEPLVELRRELDLYPPGFLKRIGMTDIHISDELKERNRTCNGLAYSTGETFISIDHSRDRKESLHHEIFHHIDYSTLYRNRSSHTKLGQLKTKVYEWSWRNINEGDDSFIDPYGSTEPMEDRATIAAKMMTEPRALKAKTRNNTVLRLKVNGIFNRYKKASKGLMDNNYFLDLANGIVDANYWDARLGK